MPQLSVHSRKKLHSRTRSGRTKDTTLYEQILQGPIHKMNVLPRISLDSNPSCTKSSSRLLLDSVDAKTNFFPRTQQRSQNEVDWTWYQALTIIITHRLVSYDTIKEVYLLPLYSNNTNLQLKTLWNSSTMAIPRGAALFDLSGKTAVRIANLIMLIWAHNVGVNWFTDVRIL